jgi:hypothetical protein
MERGMFNSEADKFSQQQALLRRCIHPFEALDALAFPPTVRPEDVLGGSLPECLFGFEEMRDECMIDPAFSAISRNA